ncbi:MAG: hypothetical protein ACOC83_00915 [Gemmatimonadota bacterium]
MNRDRDRHLSEEELELFLPESPAEAGGAIPVSARNHLEGCRSCRNHLAELESVHTALRSLPELSPSPGFTGAVMERVRLPMPWYARVWSMLREHWLVAVLVVIGLGVTVGGTSLWLAGQPGLTVGGLVDFVLGRVKATFWAGIMALGRLIYTTGLPDLVDVVRRQVGLAEMAGALAMLTLASLAAAAGMAKLLTPPPMAMHAGRSRTS